MLTKADEKNSKIADALIWVAAALFSVNSFGVLLFLMSKLFESSNALSVIFIGLICLMLLGVIIGFFLFIREAIICIKEAHGYK